MTTHALADEVARFEIFKPVAEKGPDGLWRIGYGAPSEEGRTCTVLSARLLLTQELGRTIRVMDAKPDDQWWRALTPRRQDAFAHILHTAPQSDPDLAEVVAALKAGDPAEAARKLTLTSWYQAHQPSGRADFVASLLANGKAPDV